MVELNDFVIDAGGPRGISQLEILKHAMDKLSDDADDDFTHDTKRPCEVFAMIGGTGTGGLIAILLVVLKMTANEALETFTDIVNKVFKDADRSPIKQTERLKQAISEILSKRQVLPDTKLVLPNGTPPSCRLYVPVVDKKNTGSPVILTNYVDRRGPATTLTISEAMIATCASPPMFSPVKVVKDYSRIEYISADLGLCNPIREIIEGAHSAFGDDATVICALSLGCGNSGVNIFPDSPQATALVTFLKRIALDGERKAQEVASHMEKLALYHRFSVTYGMEISEEESWKKVEDIGAHTHNYMNDGEVAATMDQCITTLKDGIGSTTLEQLINDRRQFTRTKKFRRFASVFFIDGSSKETIKRDITEHVRALGGAHSQKSFEESMKFLSLPVQGGERLLVMDNVDDPNLNISAFFPKWRRGAVIITSRNVSHGQLSPMGH
ncbi:hypothetical protein M408DRAFT_80229, partial [Serendipita vermifera MAFF 305830]